MALSDSGEQKLSDDDSRHVAATVLEELARRRVTRQHLAHEAKISLSTLEKALSGRRPFTLATIVRLEAALGVGLRRRNGAGDGAAKVAPEALGSYARPAISWIEGDYLTLRPSFSEADAVYAYLTEVRWDDGGSTLTFSEGERVDGEYSQKGVVSAPHQSGHIYFVTNKHGQYRLIIVSRPTIKGEMFGILTTLQVGRGAQLTPVATPIAFIPMKNVPHAQFGRIHRDESCYAQYRALLARTLNDSFALFLTG
ncbi:MAG: helix-turn-helix transcriptional regulator [Hyphomicrobiales bacterium]|nr:helix-turn-helix transcriptional regulator [Hyphomicrobiales bacterium]